MININENIEEKGLNLRKIIKGSIVSIIMTLILLIVFSLLLTYTKISENTIPAVIITVTAISILIGSQMATLNIKKNGIINGALVGIIYMVIIYLISSIISGSFLLEVNSIIMVFCGVVAGGIGGIIGVNMK